MEQPNDWITTLMSLTGPLHLSIGLKLSVLLGIVLLTLAISEQLYFLSSRKRLRSQEKIPGPIMAVPFIGAIVSMVMDPVRFWDKQREYAPRGISWNSIAGKFSVLVTDPEMVRVVMNNNGDDSFKMILHPNGHKLLGDNNIAFINGPTHKQLRKSFLNLFTRKALSVYLGVQEQRIREMIAKLKEIDGEFELRTYVRDLNLITSQSVFVGPYIRDQKAFSKDYLELTLGFMCFPIYFPGSQLYSSIHARKRVTKELAYCAKVSKARMEAGNEPTCLIDFWSQRVLEEIQECDSKNEPYPHYASDSGMGEVMLDFLFASQDASTASLAWIITLCSDFPEVLQKIREEQTRIRPDGEPLTFDSMEKMVYTRAVVLELLRYRAPAVFVPQITMADYKLSEDFVVPKGSMVFPSLIDACQHDFPDGKKFVPERMLPEQQENIKYRLNYLPFGVGPHQCVGREYAINHVIAFISIFAMECKWKRRKTKDSDSIQYLPTVYPYDTLITLEA